MALQALAAVARRAGLSGLVDSAKSAAAQVPVRYHSRRDDLHFYGSWKHRGHLLSIAQGAAEPLTLERFEDAIRPGDTVIDVGVYLGLYTLTAARAVGPAGRAIAIEPDPAALKHLSHSVARNGFSDRVELVHAAASDRTGTIFLDQDREGASTSTTITGKGIGVAALRLDDLNISPSVVKIDVEGAELAVLNGYAGLRKISDLFIECYPSGLRLAGQSPEALVARVRSSGLTSIEVIDEFRGVVTDWPPDLNSAYTNLHCRTST